LKELGVETVKTEMTFGVSRDYGLFEWAGTSLSSLFAQKENLTNPSMWRMILDIIRFNQYALDLLREDEDLQWDSPLKRANGKLETIGEYLDREGYSESFRNDYLIPMTAAVWSTSPDKCSLEFPAVTLVRFM
jgi:predicted NAD/FAD-binding protein